MPNYWSMMSGRERTLLVGTGISLCGLVAALLSSVIQLLATVYSCEKIGRELGQSAAAAEIDLGIEPVVRCQTEAGVVELPLAGTIVALLFATIGIVAAATTLGSYLRRLSRRN